MMYPILYTLHKQNKCKSNWMNNVKNIITNNGYGNVWMSQNIFCRNWFRLSFKQKLIDQFLQNWNALINNSSSGINYRIFKNKFGLNKYFQQLNNKQCRILTAFRTRNHRLPIEIGRWNALPASERKCYLCNCDIGDEYHYLLTCNSFKDERFKHIKPYFRINPKTFKMQELMNTSNVIMLKELVAFLNIIMNAFRSP